MRNKKTDFDTAPVCPATPAADERAPVGDERAALAQLEAACDTLCRLRTQEQYLSMVDSGQQDALLALDDARAQARAALASAPVVKPSPEHFKPPFGNCSFRMCDLPGQCRGEGKCHHPAGAPVADERAALGWYAEHVAGCRKLGPDGDAARQALDKDGGERARAALASAPVAGEAQADDLNKKLFEAAILDLAAISEHLGLEPDEGGAEPIIGAIDELRRERDSWVNAQRAADDEAAPQASPAADGRDAKDETRKTAGNIQEPMNGDGWHVVWWNESMRLMLPDGSRLDRFQGYRNGTMQLTIKTDAAIAAQQGEGGK